MACNAEIYSNSTEHHVCSKLPTDTHTHTHRDTEQTHTHTNTHTHKHTHTHLAGPHLRIQIWIDSSRYSSYNDVLLVILPASSFFLHHVVQKRCDTYLGCVFWYFRVVWIAPEPQHSQTGQYCGTQRHVRSNVQDVRTIQNDEGSKQNKTKSFFNTLCWTCSNTFQTFIQFHGGKLPSAGETFSLCLWNFLGRPYAIWASKTLYQPSSRTHLEL